MPFFLIGNKMDLKREVDMKRINQILMQNPHLVYCEIAAKQGHNIFEVLSKMEEKVLARLNVGKPTNRELPPLKENAQFL